MLRDGAGGGMERAVVVARRRRWGWYGEGGSSGMETATGVVQRGGGSGMERAMGVVRRGWRRRHGDDDGGGTERVAAVACRGWVDGVGGMSLWAGSMLGL